MSPGIQIVLLPIIRGLLVERRLYVMYTRDKLPSPTRSAANPISPDIAIRSARSRASYAIGRLSNPIYRSLPRFNCS